MASSSSKVANSSNIADLVRLALFPRVVMAPLPQGCRLGKAQAFHVLSERFNKWCTSSLVQIISRLTPEHPMISSRRPLVEVLDVEIDEFERLRKRNKSLVAAGTVGKAAKELVSS